VKPDEVKRALLIKLRHIGDVLLCAPTFKALKEAYPGVRTTALVLAGTEDMLTLNPDVDEVLTIDRDAGLAGSLRLIYGLRERRFDLAVNMTEGDRGAILAYLSGAKYRIGVHPKGRGFLKGGGSSASGYCSTSSLPPSMTAGTGLRWTSNCSRRSG